MTELRLYHGVADPAAFCAELLARRLLPGSTSVNLRAADADMAARLDRRLWTLPKETDFIPHCMANDAMAGNTPVVITHPGLPAPGRVRDALVSLAADVEVGEATSYLHFIAVLGEPADGHAQFLSTFAGLAGRGHSHREFDMARPG